MLSRKKKPVSLTWRRGNMEKGKNLSEQGRRTENKQSALLKSVEALRVLLVSITTSDVTQTFRVGRNPIGPQPFGVTIQMKPLLQ